ncbi:hypothetical protein [Pseudomonas sp. BN411]|uniref:pilus assembly protein n=1 Tax=Pseudomonas sp. BN411 TaxID=2567887 RepID=UPI0032AE99C3
MFMTRRFDAALPNVLIILDNTANWSTSAGSGRTKFDIEREALAKVVAGLDVNAFNVGLMLFSESGDGNAAVSGGYVRSAISRMTADNKLALQTLITNLQEGSGGGNSTSGGKGNSGGGGSTNGSGDKGSSAEYAKAMDEAYRYFQGIDARSGDKIKTDQKAFSVKPKYAKPTTDACAANYIIFISNGAPDNSENNKAKDMLQAWGGDITQINLTPSGRQANFADEYARFMNGKKIKTYTIDVAPETGGQGPDNTALLHSMAQSGGGGYNAVFNADELKQVLDDTFKQIQDVNSVFASTALPVSVNVRGTYLNEVYMGIFRPDADAHPRWIGNLKLYQFAKNTATGALYLADARTGTPPPPAQNPATGFIDSKAVSFWTKTSDYWSFSTLYTASDMPDGDIVEKGGAAQRQRSDYATRKLYTCTGTCTLSSTLNRELSLTPFVTDNAAITAGSLGITDDPDGTKRTALINWVRGADNTPAAERAAGGVRPSLHGDVVHSRPAVVNFNRTGSSDNDIVAFYGANDGVLRAIKGGKFADNGGAELWGFIAPEFFGQLKRQRDNSPDINVPSVAGSDPNIGNNKPYAVDGNISIHSFDVNGDGRLEGADKVYLYATMRRGGRFIYAIDVSVPETPKMMWKRGCFGATPVCDSGYDELGQTWSEAKTATVNLAGTVTPVLILGAGYDPAADDVEPAGTNTMGRGILVINALTGDLIWQAGPAPKGAGKNLTVSGMTHSIPADIAVIDRNRDGLADRLYGVDTGANVWRVDIGDQDVNNWAVHHFASLGGSGTNARKFLYGPDVAVGEDSNGPYDAVLLGSGDREHPFETVVDNHFFMLKDRNTGNSGAEASTITLTQLYNATSNLIQSSDVDVQAEARRNMLSASGWYFNLADNEKVVGNAAIDGGSVFFATNQPKPVTDPNSCASNLGTARLYVVNFENGAPITNLDGADGDDRFFEASGGGLPPSPTSVITDLGATVCFGPHCLPPPKVSLNARQRKYWFKSID